MMPNNFANLRHDAITILDTEFIFLLSEILRRSKEERGMNKCEGGYTIHTYTSYKHRMMRPSEVYTCQKVCCRQCELSINSRNRQSLPSRDRR